MRTATVLRGSLWKWINCFTIDRICWEQIRWRRNIWRKWWIRSTLVSGKPHLIRRIHILISHISTLRMWRIQEQHMMLLPKPRRALHCLPIRADPQKNSSSLHHQNQARKIQLQLPKVSPSLTANLTSPFRDPNRLLMVKVRRVSRLVSRKSVMPRACLNVVGSPIVKTLVRKKRWKRCKSMDLITTKKSKGQPFSGKLWRSLENHGSIGSLHSLKQRIPSTSLSSRS